MNKLNDSLLDTNIIGRNTQYVSSGLVLHLDGLDNTGDGHNASATTWTDLTGTVSAATKGDGTTTWGANYLSFDGSTNWSIGAPSGSYGTSEACVWIDPTLSPTNTTVWYTASTIWGCELSGTQKDWAIIINKNGYFAIGYSKYTIYSSGIYALDNRIHTISYAYLYGTVKFWIDGYLVTTIEYAPSGTALSTIGIGWNYSGTGTRIKGSIYSIRFYNRILADYEVWQNWQADNEKYQFSLYANLNYELITATLICTISGRTYTKKNAGWSIVGYQYDGTYTGPCIVGLTADSVVYTALSVDHASEGSLVYNGTTYYYGGASYWMSGNLTDSSGLGRVKMTSNTHLGAATELLDRYFRNGY